MIWSGLAFNIVATDSMVPTLDPTDMVVTVGPNVIEPEIGSVVVFTARLFDADIPPHVHRIIGVEANGDWITKGDNAVDPDPWRVKPQDVTGVMIGAVPTQIMRNPVLLGSALFVMLALLFWPRNGGDSRDGTGDGDEDQNEDGNLAPEKPDNDDESVSLVESESPTNVGSKLLPGGTQPSNSTDS